MGGTAGRFRAVGDASIEGTKRSSSYNDVYKRDKAVINLYEMRYVY